MNDVISIDVEKIVESFGGDMELFSKYFKIFRKNYPERIGCIENNINGGCDFEEMYRVVHTLKGTVANFHVTKLIEMAEDLEKTIETNNMDDIKIHYGDFKANIENLISEIEKFLKD